MCVVALAWQAHPDWQFIAIGNRDELHARPALALARWEDSPHIIAGRDVQAGGTWLGISDPPDDPGRFAVVTNIAGFGLPDPEKASRGDLIRDYLENTGSPNEPNALPLAEFNPFSLITIEGNQAWVHANRPETLQQRLDPGLHGLSNGPVDNAWPKTGFLKRQLKDWMTDGNQDPDRLLTLLQDENAPAAASGFTPMPDLPRDPRTVPVFIRNAVYGTRCSTVVLVDGAGQGQILERSYDSNGDVTGDRSAAFVWQH
ncbi:MAG: NRDE family protein [Pseudomonadota bacterium]